MLCSALLPWPALPCLALLLAMVLQSIVLLLLSFIRKTAQLSAGAHWELQGMLSTPQTPWEPWTENLQKGCRGSHICRPCDLGDGTGVSWHLCDSKKNVSGLSSTVKMETNVPNSKIFGIINYLLDNGISHLRFTQILAKVHFSSSHLWDDGHQFNLQIPTRGFSI